MSVEKPATAGAGQLAMMTTSGSWVNVRTGPGTEYEDIGDIYSGVQVTYYPNSNTNGWVWVERITIAGWIYSNVAQFEDIDAPIIPEYPPTPYDGASSIWHWKGQAVSENTIHELAKNIKLNTPNVKHLFVKVGDGDTWQGQFDSGDMAVNGPESVDYWAGILSQYGIGFHAWIVLKGVNPDGEADIIIKTGKRPGVKSIIFDIEPFDGYWEGGSEPIRPMMIKIRQALGSAFHLGIAIDPRRNHYAAIYPREWLPFINSVHPMCYWSSFHRDVLDVFQETYDVWGNYGRPIIPIMQGYAPIEEQAAAFDIATKRFGAKGLSWWRYGQMSQWSVANTPVPLDGNTTDSTDIPPENTRFGKEVIIFSGEAGHRRGSYTGKEEFIKFTNVMAWNSYYTTTEPQTSKVWSEWKTQLPEDGIYQISVFIPGRHATTTKARYKIHGIRGTNTEVIVDINQSIHRNEWVPLGIFDLVKNQTNAGKVFLNDVTGERGKEVAFDAIRWRQIVKLDNPTTGNGGDIVNGVYVADGYESPVGTAAERAGQRLWPSGWLDASPFGRLYFVGTSREAYHTGADLNWGTPYADKGLPTYACASGVIVFAGYLKIWGNVVVIRHDPLRSPTGKVMYSRYGHVQNILVKAGQRVKRGDQVAEIGDAFGAYVPHLHFDLSPTQKLETSPGDWPAKDATRLFRDYVDPLKFIGSNRP